MVSCSKDETPTNTNTNNTSNLSEREKVLADYENYFEKTRVTDPKWTGNDITCVAGDVDRSTINNLMKTRLNYFRRLVGLKDIELNTDPTYVKQCQEASLIMSANWMLSHYPQSNWHCYSEEGAEGAAKSQLAFSFSGHSTGGIRQLIEDAADQNTHVGHRRWLLYTKATGFTYGSTEMTCAIRVHKDYNKESKEEYVAYPVSYFPEKLVYKRWSCAIPGAYFDNADVKMLGPDGKDVSLKITYRYKKWGNIIGDNAIVWEPSIDLDVSEDKKYTITVSGVENALKDTYTYDVIIVDQD